MTGRCMTGTVLVWLACVATAVAADGPRTGDRPEDSRPLLERAVRWVAPDKPRTPTVAAKPERTVQRVSDNGKLRRTAPTTTGPKLGEQATYVEPLPVLSPEVSCVAHPAAAHEVGGLPTTPRWCTSAVHWVRSLGLALTGHGHPGTWANFPSRHECARPVVYLNIFPGHLPFYGYCEQQWQPFPGNIHTVVLPEFSAPGNIEGLEPLPHDIPEQIPPQGTP